MDPDTLEDETPGQSAKRGDQVNDSTSVLEDVQSLWNELHGLAYNHFRLAALETRRAGESLVSMIIAGVMVAFLLSSAWLGLMAAAVLELIGNGIAASSAILLAVAFNLLLALFLCRVMRRKSRYLHFPAILRSLQPRSPVRRAAQKS
jgi:hypothetical protein